jgi:hypothetical protein
MTVQHIRIKTDGTEKTKLAGICSFKGAMWVSGGSVYYIDGTSLMKIAEDWLYRSNLDGSNKMELK